MALPRFRATERQFLLLLLTASLLTVGAAFLWRELFRPRADRLAPGGVARVFWLRDANPSEVRLRLAEYLDPTLMALPNPRGFSAAAWARRAPATPPRFVPPRSAVYQPAPTNLPVRELLPPPALTARLTDGLERLPLGGETPAEPAPATSAAPPAETTVEILGPLAGRRLVVVPPLPRAPGPAAVRRSRVWIAVGPDGRVRHAVLERASGNEPLDQLAVDLARQLEFERQISPDPLAVTWGIARFVWAVSHDAGNAQGPAAGHPGRR